MVDVEIVGGPHDGEVWALPDGVRVVKIAVPMNPTQWLRDEGVAVSSRDPGYRALELPVELTWNGYRAYWREPTC